MTMLLQLLLSGFAMGSIYALVALGFVLLVNGVNLINLAQGEFVMVGAFFAYTFSTMLGLPYWVTILGVIACSALFGIAFARIGYWPLRNAGVATAIIGTVGVSVFTKNIAMNVWGPIPIYYSEPFGRMVLQVGSIRIVPQHLLIIGTTIALLIAVFLFFEKTRLGLMMRAVSEDKSAAALIGIKISSVTLLTFAISAVFGAIAGLLVAPVFFITVEMGTMVGLKAFIASIIGGWGSIPGAIVGGIILGILEVMSAAYVSAMYKDVFAFIFLILMMIILPRGIFGERVSEKV